MEFKIASLILACLAATLMAQLFSSMADVMVFDGHQFVVRSRGW